MSDEKKTWNFHLVYTDIDDEQVAKLHELTHKDMSPDIATQIKQVHMILQFLLSYAHHVHSQCQIVNFNLEDENFSNHPKAILSDLKARSAYVLKNYQRMLDGRLQITGLQNVPLEILIKTLTHLIKEAEKDND